MRRLEEATEAKLKELDRLAEFGVYEIVVMHNAHSSRHAASDDTLGSGLQERRNQSTMRCERVQG